MNTRPTSLRYPFALISQTGLGTSFSADYQQGASVPAKAMGQANVNVSVNVNTGNLAISDTQLSFADVGGNIELGYQFNSLDGVWRLAAGRQLTFTADGRVATVIGKDGHVVSYAEGADGVYLANEADKSRDRITFDSEKNLWVSFNSATLITEYFTTNGTLAQQVDQYGNTTGYEYDANNQVNKIVGASGAVYTIDSTKDRVVVNTGEGADKKPIHNYELNERGQVTRSINSDLYEVNYHYDANHKLDNISQTDGTSQTFTYTDNKLTALQTGDDIAQHTFSYQDAKSVFTDASGSNTEFDFTSDRRIETIKQDSGTANSDVKQDEWKYQYNNVGQLVLIEYPNKSLERWDSRSVDGLLDSHTKVNGTTETYVYQATGFPLLLSKSIFSDEANVLVTHNIYNETNQLIFTVTPAGLVKEITYDNRGLIQKVAEYTQATFNLDSSTKPSCADVLAWKAANILEGVNDSVALLKFSYDNAGQVSNKSSYLAQAGKDDSALIAITSEDYEHDIAGRLTKKTVKIEGGLPQISTFEWNANGLSLRQVIGVCSDVEQVTTCNYNQNTVTKTNPNKQVQIDTMAANGQLVSSKAVSADASVTREVTFNLEANGEVGSVVGTDGKVTVTIHDKAHRLRFNITPRGVVTEHTYNRENRYETTISYAKLATAVDIAALKSGQAVSLAGAKDRTEYKFFNASGLVQFEVNADNYVIENQYDEFNRLTNKIRYVTKLTIDELTALQSKSGLNRVASAKDRVQSYFYDNDNRVVAEIDPQNYVIRYERNASGLVTNTKRYESPVTTRFATINALASALSTVKSFDSRCYYNALNQLILEVDAAGYATSHEYYPDNKQKSSVRYYTPVNRDILNGNTLPLVTVSAQDQTTLFKYDALRRLVQVVKPFGRIETLSYDAANNVIASDIKDASNSKVDGDNYRGQRALFDSFSQATQQANPYVTKLIKEIELSSLSVSEKQEKIAAIIAALADKTIYDNSGLKLTTIDAAGLVTYYYYDQDRQPVMTVTSLGAITTSIYDAFGQVTSHTQLYNKFVGFDATVHAPGFINQATLDKVVSLANKAKDVVTTYDHDNRNNITSITDALARKVTYLFTAFNQCESETQLAYKDEPELALTREFDTRGHTITTTRKSADLKSVVTAKFDHYLGRQTETIDELGQVVRLGYDDLGRQQSTKKLAEDGVSFIETTQALDAFNRPVETVAANAAKTVYAYATDKKSVTATDPLGATVVSTANVFDDIIKKRDALQHEETMSHEADGQLLAHTIGGATTVTDHDIMGRECLVTNPNGMETEFKRDVAGNLTNVIQDRKGLHAETTYKINALGQRETVTDALGVVTDNTFDRMGYLQSANLDRAALDHVSQFEHDSAGNVSLETKGDGKVADQYQLKSTYDGFKRQTASIVDPMGLALRTSYEHDLAGNITCTIDANGSAVRTVFNKLQQPRFIATEHKNVTDALSSLKIKEYEYTATGKIKSERDYFNLFNGTLFNGHSSIDHLSKFVTSEKNQLDGYKCRYYDSKDRERFVVKFVKNPVTGLTESYINEKRYDAANNIIETVRYSASAGLVAETATTILTQNIEATANALAAKENKNRVVHRYYDSAGRETFSIDQAGKITEKQYDKCGNLIAHIRYGKKIDVTAGFPAHDNTVNTLLADYVGTPRAKYMVYDALGRETHVIAENGSITQKDYNKCGKVTSQCVYKQFAVPSKNYAELCAQVKSLTPNREIDSVTTTKYDNAGNVESITDPLGYTDYYKRDALGSAREHTDRIGKVWTNTIDRAMRLTVEETPEITVYATQLDEATGKLSKVGVKTKIATKTEFDNVNNATAVTHGYGIENVTNGIEKSRRIEFGFTPDKKVASSTVDNVTVTARVDDKNVEAVANQSIKTQIIYNSQGLKAAECDVQGVWNSYFYDSLGRLIYEVQAQSRLIKYTYNSFNQLEEEYRYATPFTLSLPLSIDSLSYISAINLLNNHPVCPDDRKITTDYDNSGLVSSTLKPEVMCAVDNGIAFARPATGYLYNTFGDVIYAGRMVTPTVTTDGKDVAPVWAEKFTWYDDHGQVRFELNENNYITEYIRDVNNKILFRIEYSEKIETPDNVLKISADEFKKLIITNAKDRKIEFIYDQRGDKKEERIYNNPYQKTVKNDDGTYKLETVANEFTKTNFEYSPTQKLRRTIYEELGIEERFYDECDRLVVELGIASTSQDDDGKDITLTPYKRYLLNAFGQTIAKQETTDGQLRSRVTDPEPYPLNQESITETLTLFDNRGLTAATQDARGNVKSFIYTVFRKIAVESFYLTSFVKKNLLSNNKPEVKMNSIKSLRLEAEKPLPASEDLNANWIDTTCDKSVNVAEEPISDNVDTVTLPPGAVSPLLGVISESAGVPLSAASAAAMAPIEAEEALAAIDGIPSTQKASVAKAETKNASTRNALSDGVLAPPQTVPMSSMPMLGDEGRYDQTKYRINKVVTFDRFMKPTRAMQLYNGGLEEVVYSSYSEAFGDYLGESDKPITPDSPAPSYQKIDGAGKPWFSNSDNGISTIYVRNLLGFEVYRFRSHETDLSLVEPAGVQALFSADRSDVLMTHSMRDKGGRVFARRDSHWYEDSVNFPLPTRGYSYDHWNNVTDEYDAYGNHFVKIYDVLNNLREDISPETDAVQDDNTTIRQMLHTIYSRNSSGALVATTDPKNHTQLFVLNESNNLLKHILADGLVTERRRLNVFNHPIDIFDSIDNKVTYRYDENKNNTHILFPDRTIRYLYDEADNRNCIVTGSGAVIRHNYDGRGNCMHDLLNRGQVNTRNFEHNGLPTQIYIAGQIPITFKRDFFGDVTAHVDLNYQAHEYFYDLCKKLKTHTSTGGLSRASVMMWRDGRFLDLSRPRDVDVTNTYGFGKLRRTIDIGANRQTDVEFDKNLFKTRIEMLELDTQKLIVTINTQPDELGREIKTTNVHTSTFGIQGLSEVNTRYDAASNRRHRYGQVSVPAIVWSDNWVPQVFPINLWSTVDPAGRPLIVGGVLDGNNVVQIAPNQGLSLTHTNGYRTIETRINNSGICNVGLNYSNEGKIRQTNCTQNNFSTDRSFHPGGWVYSSNQRTGDGNYTNRVLTCDNNEWTDKEETFDTINGGHMGAPYKYSQSNYAKADNGVPAVINTYLNVYRNTTTIDTTLTYMGSDVPMLYLSQCNKNSRDGYYSSITSKQLHDSNYQPIRKIDSEDEVQSAVGNPRDPHPYNIFLDVTNDGFAVNKISAYPSSPLFPNYMQICAMDHIIYSTYGNAHGVFSDGFVNFSSPAFKPFEFIRPIGPVAPIDDSAKNNPMAGEYVDQYLSDYPQVYQVQSGDTFESIAQSLFGDRSRSYELEKVNGYLLKQTLKTGQFIFVPQVVPNKDTSDTARPYHDFVTLMCGKLMPNLSAFPTKKHNKNHMLGNLIKLIAIAIVLILAPHLAPALVPYIISIGAAVGISVTGATATAIATGVIAAVGDAAVQGVAIKTGVQQRFSFEEMLETGVGAGAMSGLAMPANLTELAENMLYIGSVQISTQLAEMAAGVRKRFDLKEVAVQVVSSVASSEVSEFEAAKLGTGLGANIVTNSSTTVINSLLGKAVMHTPLNLQNMATQALGTTIGNEIGSRIANNIGNKTPVHVPEVTDIDLPAIPGQLPTPGLPLDQLRHVDEVTYGLSEKSRLSMDRWKQASSATKTWGHGSTTTSHTTASVSHASSSKQPAASSAGLFHGSSKPNAASQHGTTTNPQVSSHLNPQKVKNALMNIAKFGGDLAMMAMPYPIGMLGVTLVDNDLFTFVKNYPNTSKLIVGSAMAEELVGERVAVESIVTFKRSRLAISTSNEVGLAIDAVAQKVGMRTALSVEYETLSTVAAVERASSYLGLATFSSPIDMGIWLAQYAGLDTAFVRAYAYELGGKIAANVATGIYRAEQKYQLGKEIYQTAQGSYKEMHDTFYDSEPTARPHSR